VAAELFVNGAGQRAERLVLISKFGFDLGGWAQSVVQQRIEAALTAAEARGRQQAEQERHRRACECQEPDPVMQADAKFYCYRCSFETGARPNSLEPEQLLMRVQQAEQARDEGQGYQRGQPYTIEQQLHDQKQRSKGLENRIRKELEPQVSALTQALKDIAERHRFPARELGPCICKEHQAADRLTGAQA